MDIESRFNYLVGGLALLSAIVSALWFSRNFRPSVLVKQLDELLHDTISLYDSYVADGLLDDQQLREGIRRELLKLQRSANAAKEETYKIKTTAGEYSAVFRGEWKNIRVVSARIIDFRAELIRTSQEVRKNRETSGAENAQNVFQTESPSPAPSERALDAAEIGASNVASDSISVTCTLVEKRSSLRLSFFGSFLTGWSPFRLQNKVRQDDVERGSQELLVTPSGLRSLP